MPAPEVSVVLPVHNGIPFIDAAVASILGQDFGDFELVILDDASTDATPERLRYWAERDARVRIVSHPGGPLGLVGSSNAVVRAARAQIVARQDADDVSRPDRLRRQLQVLRDRLDVVVVGSLARGIDADGRVVRPRDLARLLPSYAAPPAPHSSWMFRKEAFERVGGYAEDSEGFEDKAFLQRLSTAGRIVMLPAPLVDTRYHTSGSTITTEQTRRERLLAQERTFIQKGRSVNNARSDSYRLRAALRVWAGSPPDVKVRWPAWSGDRRVARSVPILLYSTWGKISPRSLRAVLSTFIRARNLVLSRRFREGKPVPWPTAHS